MIPLSKAKANLSKYARDCRKESIVVTVNGEPSFEIVPINPDDDLIDQLIAHNPKFRKMLEARLKGKTISADEMRKRLR